MSLKDQISSKQMPTFNQAITHLIESIALEEEALSRLMNSEADNMTAFVGKKVNFPTNPTTAEIIQFNQSVVGLLDTILMAEWMLLKKMDAVIHIAPREEPYADSTLDADMDMDMEMEMDMDMDMASDMNPAVGMHKKYVDADRAEAAELDY
ncbi:hypothetical protein [Paenibacillus eucommiae]|uniref:Uncharacterized protein n=1 Tax=Paenibacillus eucommiae TaxID=1355755 RepID=A0ABS4ITF2_9BACL|nr:hypothetical protein [Paenibacillus eucommiae]MBP1990793.1 hypothetical protein [Paenibacillus eucommiae]